ncbi:4-hydroxythreonine-4-phosphate dehydrogenase [Geodia barretti]|nr:4-hydroxythreonine-4-phosphate dehydrogenase [Geodia barretti]
MGHTEYLAELTGSKCPVMLLTDGELRVALVTTHIPLNQVAEAVTCERVTAVATVLHNDLRSRLDIASPRIGVCGLNPHAGEGGVLGDEEIEKIIPAIEMLQKQGIKCSRTSTCRYDIRSESTRKIRCHSIDVPRSGIAGGQICRIRRSGECHTRTAHYSYLSRPRNCLRNCRYWQCRNQQPVKRC